MSGSKAKQKGSRNLIGPKCPGKKQNKKVIEKQNKKDLIGKSPGQKQNKKSLARAQTLLTLFSNSEPLLLGESCCRLYSH